MNKEIVEMTPLEILTSYLAGTLLLVYFQFADPSTSPSSPSLPPPWVLPFPFIPTYGYLWVASYGFSNWYRDLVFWPSLLFGHSLWFQAKKLLVLSPKGGGVGSFLPLPYKYQIIGYISKNATALNTTIEVLTQNFKWWHFVLLDINPFLSWTTYFEI